MIYLALYHGRRDGTGWRVWAARFTDGLTRVLTRGRYGGYHRQDDRAASAAAKSRPGGQRGISTREVRTGRESESKT